jgi:hypothetical protein
MDNQFSKRDQKPHLTREQYLKAEGLVLLTADSLEETFSNQIDQLQNKISILNKRLTLINSLNLEENPQEGVISEKSIYLCDLGGIELPFQVTKDWFESAKNDCLIQIGSQIKQIEKEIAFLKSVLEVKNDKDGLYNLIETYLNPNNKSLLVTDESILVSIIDFALFQFADSYKDDAESDSIKIFNNSKNISDQVHTRYDQLILYKIRYLFKLGLIDEFLETLNYLVLSPEKVLFTIENQKMFFEVINYLIEILELDKASNYINQILLQLEEVSEKKLSELNIQKGSKNLLLNQFNKIVQDQKATFESLLLRVINTQNQKLIAQLNVSANEVKPTKSTDGNPASSKSKKLELMENLAVYYSLAKKSDGIIVLIKDILTPSINIDDKRTLIKYLRAYALIKISEKKYSEAITIFEALERKRTNYLNYIIEDDSEESIIEEALSIIESSNSENNIFVDKFVSKLGIATAIVHNLKEIDFPYNDDLKVQLLNIFKNIIELIKQKLSKYDIDKGHEIDVLGLELIKLYNIILVINKHLLNNSSVSIQDKLSIVSDEIDCKGLFGSQAKLVDWLNEFTSMGEKFILDLNRKHY